MVFGPRTSFLSIKCEIGLWLSNDKIGIYDRQVHLFFLLFVIFIIDREKAASPLPEEWAPFERVVKWPEWSKARNTRHWRRCLIDRSLVIKDIEPLSTVPQIALEALHHWDVGWCLGGWNIGRRQWKRLRKRLLPVDTLGNYSHISI